jgi:hypothetical protein
VQAEAQARGAITGTLQVGGRTYALTGTAVDPAIPAPVLEWDTAPLQSGQQRKVTMRLPSPAPVTVTGFLDATFEKDSVLAVDDPAVMFLESGSRRVSFRVEQGQTAATLNGLAYATLQTGTTAGRIRLTFAGVPAGFTGDPTVTWVLAPAQVVVDRVVAARLLDQIEVKVTGFDNTYSAGAMVFRFYDAAGQAMTTAIPADFTTQFREFFTAQAGGSVFQMTVRFPVSGDSSPIRAVEAELINSAGTQRVARVSLP